MSLFYDDDKEIQIWISKKCFIFQLATSDTDEALSKALNRHLTPSLLKLSSTQENVRKKVMELLVHINKRVKNNDNIQLPMAALLDQYQDPSVSSFVTNFTIIYIKMGFPRLPLDQKIHLIPKILLALEGKPASHQDPLLHMMLPWLEHVKAPKEDPEIKAKYLKLEENPHCFKLFLEFLFDFILLPYGSHPSIKPSDPNEKIQVPPGLSENAWKKVAGDSPMKPEDLEKIKANIMRFLGNGLIPEKNVAMHLVIGMADTRHSVSTEADSVMRRVSGGIDWEQKELVSKLYDMFLGTLMVKGKDGKYVTTSATGVVHIRPENKKMPSSTRLRLKLMPYLLRSKEASLSFPTNVQVVFDLLFGTGGNTNAKLKTMAVQFVHSVVENCPTSRMTSCGGVLLSALNKLVSGGAASKESNEDEPMSNAEKDAAAKLRASCYVAIGNQIDTIINPDLPSLASLFNKSLKLTYDLLRFSFL